ncbi:hypothetical protein [Emticicia sp. TH156]|uniref:hypothetical protein n=1 Tax=Emticicia sp. TH156 TaxID=2067454 RepID=UPI000C775163|nr:hypothetical protein [Emticicia sp. TH156]PLK42917.1 hypothetical protein C0V77_18575 [Emticicia sp. TH156]
MENLRTIFTDFPLEVLLIWFLLTGFLWWFMNREIGKWKSKSTELLNRIKFLEGELDACRKTRISVSVDSATSAGQTAGIAGSSAANATLPPPVKDDLKIVEGIGPKIEELFNKAGIYTFAQLADTPVSKMKEILDKAGSRFHIHDPTTWADQSSLARDGKWDELKKWQDELYKGRL